MSFVPTMTAPENTLRAAPRPALHVLGLCLYYAAILVLLLWIYGRGDTPTAPFVYQGF